VGEGAGEASFLGCEKRKWRMVLELSSGGQLTAGSSARTMGCGEGDGFTMKNARCFGSSPEDLEKGHSMKKIPTGKEYQL